MTTPSPSSSEQILAFWHKVEFFVSPDLKELQDGTGSAIQYPYDELATRPDCLPWLNREHLRRASTLHEPEKPYTFKLYLGIFSRSEIFRIAHKYYPENTEGPEERNADEGHSCSMTVMVDEYGRIKPDSFEFSTAPWALGEVMHGRLDEMTMQAFETATRQFQDRLTAIVTVADNVKRAHDLPPLLTTFELIEMLKAVSSWTPFTASSGGTPALYVQPFEIRGERAEAWEKAQHPCLTASSFCGLSTELPAAFQSEMTGSQAPQESDEIDQGREVDLSDEITILNSFFIRDLERVIRVLKITGLAPDSPLSRYLRNDCGKHPDLLLPEGRSLLMQVLAPERVPRGRWPGEDAHSMSLMQQFAINAIDQELEETGLYSVNGPPGTGKTTMLRDLVASNMVKRAEVLASLPSEDAAFGPDLEIKVGKESRTIKTLIPELTGFEMVVASNNNAAVENITQELPQSKALGKAYQALSCLKSVGQKLAANHELRNDKKTHVDELSPEQDCWGLIATALGNSRNRKTFGDRLYFKPVGTKTCVGHGEAAGYLTLVSALKALAKGGNGQQDFYAAQSAFNAASEKVAQMQRDLKQLQSLQQLERDIETARNSLSRQRRTVSRLKQREEDVKNRKVSVWPLKTHRRRSKTLKRVRNKLKHVEQNIEIGKQWLNELERRVGVERDNCASLLVTYSDALLPDDTLDLETAEMQRTSFGHCEALNQARAQLTACAFELHQAWLVAAYAGKNKLWPTIQSINDVIKGSIEDQSGAKVLWQMLFMIVPVVSSTFASVANQFRMLGEGDIGWLFVDEAGQASPQQAVGALWRARRAVVVGDPLQIEPVFTVPVPLVEALAGAMLGDDWKKWSPAMASVQVVADQANPYGTNEISDELWVGSPLRVHRRCDEPMFSISNRIAYNDKMFHGNDDLPQGSGDSRWFDVSGEVEGKHFVPDQAAQVTRMLKRYIEQTGKPPSVYVISPFKAVARGLRDELENALNANAFGGTSELRKWLKARVGTVHTFQGKEEDSVILVLGLSENKPGAAEWASGTPNLLNVALTRAKKRVYVVGSMEIWGSKQYFSVACEKLPIQAVADYC